MSTSNPHRDPRAPRTLGPDGRSSPSLAASPARGRQFITVSLIAPPGRRCRCSSAREFTEPFVKLAPTMRQHKAGVPAAIELTLSNGRLEGLNSKVRLLSHRSYGFTSALGAVAVLVDLGLRLLDLP